MNEIKSHILQTPWGVSINGYYRVGRSDLDTLISCIAQDEYKLELHNLRPGMIAIDLGAHIGAATLALGSKGIKVYAVECLPGNIEILMKNISENNYYPVVYHAAIGGIGDRKVVAYHTKPKDSTGYIHEYIGCTIPHAQLSSLAEDGDIVEVPEITLNEIFDRNQIDYCDFLKIDCEGAEWEAIESVRPDVLDKIGIISGELHTIWPGKEVSHGNLLPYLKGRFVDVTEIYEPVYSKPGMSTHFVYRNRDYVSIK